MGQTGLLNLNQVPTKKTWAYNYNLNSTNPHVYKLAHLILQLLFGARAKYINNTKLPPYLVHTAKYIWCAQIKLTLLVNIYFWDTKLLVHITRINIFNPTPKTFTKMPNMRTLGHLRFL